MKSFRELLESRPFTIADDPPAPSKKKSWGFHLLIDMSGCNERMNSIKDIKNFFNVLIKTLDMKKLSPIMIETVDSSPYNRGISAVQMIHTSSITFHGDDVNMCVYLDVFSCKPFEPKKVLKLVKEYFTPRKIADQMIYRDAGSIQK